MMTYHSGATFRRALEDRLLAQSNQTATSHLAEKLNAYVRPRPKGESTRVKDLVDILLVAEHMEVNGPALLAAIRATFAVQGDCELPLSLPAPPAAWAATFRRLSEEVGLRQTSLQDAGASARRFLDPVLSGSPVEMWSPGEQEWTRIRN